MMPYLLDRQFKFKLIRQLILPLSFRITQFFFFKSFHQSLYYFYVLFKNVFSYAAYFVIWLEFKSTFLGVALERVVIILFLITLLIRRVDKIMISAHSSHSCNFIESVRFRKVHLKNFGFRIKRAARLHPIQ